MQLQSLNAATPYRDSIVNILRYFQLYSDDPSLVYSSMVISYSRCSLRMVLLYKPNAGTHYRQNCAMHSTFGPMRILQTISCLNSLFHPRPLPSLSMSMSKQASGDTAEHLRSILACIVYISEGRNDALIKKLEVRRSILVAVSR